VRQVRTSKLEVVPEPVDTKFFDPQRAKLKATTNPIDKPIFPRGGGAAASVAASTRRPYRFFSVFKFEERKGWDLLLAALLDEFARPGDCDRVELYLLTNRFHDDGELSDQVKRYIKQHTSAAAAAGTGQGAGVDLDQVPRIYVIDSHVPQKTLPALYKAMDCFVLPSRGEGWGRPHVEAMAMALPVIATNWSGPTAFLTEDNGFPLAITGLEQVKTGPWRKHHSWAAPSVPHLRQLMRAVVDDPAGARRKGAAARAHMVQHFSPKKVADVVMQHLRRVEAKLAEDGAL